MGISEIIKWRANRTNEKIESMGGIDGIVWGNCNRPVSPYYPYYIPSLDPSSFVYEAVESNRVQGAMATVIQQVTKLDMYDEEYTEDEIWNAAPFNQTNPQTTNENGEFAWDVPDGLWSIKLTKPGYEDTQTDWMTVPPERKDVRIAMVSLEKPTVLDVVAQDNGYLITFSKYMLVDQLTGRITLKADGKAVPLTLTVVDAETNPQKNKQVATKVLAVPSKALNPSANNLLTVSGQVSSYADVSMGEDAIFDLGEQLTRIEAPDRIEALIGSSTTLKLKLYPLDQSIGRRITAKASNSAVSVSSSAVVNEKGEAVFYLSMNGGGDTVITFTVSNSTLTIQTTVSSIDPLSFNTLSLPAFMTVIEEEAFSGIAAVTVVIPNTCERIESKAFANCPELNYVIIPADCFAEIAQDAFEESNVTIIRR